MGLNLEQVFSQAADGAEIGISLISNQDNGICSYASGNLIHYARRANLGVNNPFIRPARLSTTGGEPLKYLFSDRLIDVDPPPPQGGFGNTPRQPFSANAADKLGLSIARPTFGPPVAKFTLQSWDNATFSVSFEAKGNLLVGVGPAVGNQSDHAVYVLTFTGIYRPPH